MGRGRDATLKLSANEDLPASHRHLSNLMGLHPFNLITVEGGQRDARMIAASLAARDAKGTREWCGYSFSWMSALRARVGQADEALRLLEIYAKAFILRNGFHANGDQTRSGYSNYTCRPFTLEGNFLAMHAVHEMLLQSWSATPGQRDTEVTRIFPATSARWPDASFEGLRAEGGYTVSARREHGVTTWFRIQASRAGTLRVRDNFGGRVPSWNRPAMRKAGANFEVPVKAGDVIEAAFPRSGQARLALSFWEGRVRLDGCTAGRRGGPCPSRFPRAAASARPAPLLREDTPS